MERHEITSFEAFTSIFEQNLSSKIIIAVFKGSKDPSTGISWCDDCERADPFIHASLEKSTPDSNKLFLSVLVGVREDWKNVPTNPYRTYSHTHVRCIPTLIRYENGSEVARLEEGQICNQVLADELILS
jgi:hypothetical protein